MNQIHVFVGILALCSGGIAFPAIDGGQRLASFKSDALQLPHGLQSRVDEILENNRQIEVIGNYSNKAYFTQATNMSAYGARSFCENNLMDLVSIDTQGELSYLKSTLPISRFWTSAIDASVYKWDNGGVVQFPVVPPHLTCVLLDMGGPTLYADPCDGSLGFIYSPLCQLVSMNS